MTETPINPKLIIAEVKALLNAAWNTTSKRRHNQLIKWARTSLESLGDTKEPEALWLLCSIPGGKATEHLSHEEFHQRLMAEAQAAATAGSASAQFFLAGEIYSESTMQESTALYKSAAEQGHAYAKWCYGLNLLSGQGTEKNEALGLKYIEEAAEQKFEGAINFLSQAYASGTYGYTKDEAIAASWWAKRKDKDLIHY